MDPAHASSFIQEAEFTLRTIRSYVLASGLQVDTFGLEPLIYSVRKVRGMAGNLGFYQAGIALCSLEEEFVMCTEFGRPWSEAVSRSVLDLIATAEAEILKLGIASDDLVFDAAEFVEQSFGTLEQTVENETSEPSLDQVVADAEPVDEFEPDAEMLEIFAEEAEELLTGIETNLGLLTPNPENRDALWEIRRHAHTFKGAAGIIGLKKPSKLAHRVEDLLDHLSQNDIVPNRRILDIISSAAVLLRSLTSPGQADSGADARLSDLYDRFDNVFCDEAAAFAEPPGSPDAVPAACPEPAHPQPEAKRPIIRVAITRLDDLARTVRDLVVGRATADQAISEYNEVVESFNRTARRIQTMAARIEHDFEAAMLGMQAPLNYGRGRHPGMPVSSNEGAGDAFDSLEFDQYTDFHETSRDLSEAAQECVAAATSLEVLKARLESVIELQSRLIEDTQEKVMQIRLIRFESLTTRLERAVRITCEEENKKAEVFVANPEVELDTDVLDSLVEPLMHIIRNAVVHGIESPEMRRLVGKPETGRITVSLANEETHVVMKVTDDGCGVAGTVLRERAVEAGLIDTHQAALLDNAGLLELMFLRGLTTAERLTMSAGRGVGMSIVRESIGARNGTISVDSVVQQGTTFTIRIPLAFAVANVLMVRAAGNCAAIPVRSISQIVEKEASEIIYAPEGPTVRTAEGRLNVRFLSDHFPAKQAAALVGEPLNVLLIGGGSPFALVVDEIIKTEEVAIRPLGYPLDTAKGVVGAAMLGNGTVVPVLDLEYLTSAAPAALAVKEAEPEPVRPSILVVDDSPSVRAMTSRFITSGGWEVITAKDGVEAIELLRGPANVGLILTDVEMPRMDGYELVRALQNDEALSAIPVVFITSRSGDKHREKAAELGVTEYVSKPFIESELLETIERSLKHEPAAVI